MYKYAYSVDKITLYLQLQWLRKCGNVDKKTQYKKDENNRKKVIKKWLTGKNKNDIVILVLNKWGKSQIKLLKKVIDNDWNK